MTLVWNDLIHRLRIWTIYTGAGGTGNVHLGSSGRHHINRERFPQRSLCGCCPVRHSIDKGVLKRITKHGPRR